MRIATSVLFSCAAGTMILFSSCQKDLRTLKKDEINGTSLSGQTTYCRIESIWNKGSIFVPGNKFHLISYDEFENPVFISVPRVGTANPFHVFKYDNWHRLREYIGQYANGGFEFWHRYGYHNQGRINVDTLYIFGILDKEPTQYYERRIIKLEYDGQNRIIHASTTSSFPINIPDEVFTYDSKGNLIYPASAGIVYDDKVNLNRTNDIWQFLSRDYSMNNPFIALEYNTAGLPTKMNFPQNGFTGVFIRKELFFNNGEISYSCRPAYW